MFRQRTDDHPEDEAVPGLLLLRVEGRVYFGNAERVADLLGDAPTILSLNAVSLPDMLSDVECVAAAAGAPPGVRASAGASARVASSRVTGRSKR